MYQKWEGMCGEWIVIQNVVVVLFVLMKRKEGGKGVYNLNNDEKWITN